MSETTRGADTGEALMWIESRPCAWPRPAHLAMQFIVGAKRDFAFLSQPLGEPEGQRTGCRAGRVDVGKDEIAAEMPLGKACTGSNRQPGRQIVGRAELIDVDRKSVVEGKGVSVRGACGGRRIFQKKIRKA